MTASATRTSKISPDSETVQRILYQISDHIQTQSQESRGQHLPSSDGTDGTAQELLRTLSTISDPLFAMKTLAPRLFLTLPSPSSSSDDDNAGGWNALTSHDALQLLSFLVTTSPGTYLIPASRAVRLVAEDLSFASTSVAAVSTVPEGQGENIMDIDDVDTTTTTTAATGTGPSVMMEVQVTDDILAALVTQLTGDNVEVSSNASLTLLALSKCCGVPLSIRAVESIVQTWRNVCTNSSSSSGGSPDHRAASTIAVRCASTVVDLATATAGGGGDAVMNAMFTSGGTKQLLDMVSDNTDPLVQMSALDLMDKMVNTLPMHGNRARWLVSHEVLSILIPMAGGGGVGGDDDEEEEEGPDHMNGGAALKLLSCICRLGQRDSNLFGLGGVGGGDGDGDGDGGAILLTGFHKALLRFDPTVHDGGELGRIAFVDAVSSFASASPDTIALVLDDETIRTGWLSLGVAQPKLKSVILHSVANVIDPPMEVDANGDSIRPWNVPSNQIAMRLFETLGEVNNRDTTEMLMTIAKSPIVEARLGAYTLLQAVAKRGVGAQVLLSRVGFFEFLINRERETTKEGKEAKFEIVEAVMSTEVKNLLAESVVKQLEEMLKQGPHFVVAQPWELMTEE